MRSQLVFKDSSLTFKDAVIKLKTEEAKKNVDKINEFQKENGKLIIDLQTFKQNLDANNLQIGNLNRQLAQYTADLQAVRRDYEQAYKLNEQTL